MAVPTNLKRPLIAMTVGTGALLLSSTFALVSLAPRENLSAEVPDVSKIADLCSPDRLCDGFQMRAAMRENGALSLNSPVGRALKQIGVKHDIGDPALTDLMTQMDFNFKFSKNIPTLIEADEIAFIRPPQFKKEPKKPHSISNPYMKAGFDAVVMVAKRGSGDCPTYAIRPNGSFELIESPDQLKRNVASHGITSDECAEKRDGLMRVISAGLS